MGRKNIYRSLKDHQLIDKRNIFVAGFVKSSNIKDNFYKGRSLSIKDEHLLVCRLGGFQKVAPLFVFLKENIQTLSVKKKIFGLEINLHLQTDTIDEVYNITINKKKTKDIISLFSPF